MKNSKIEKSDEKITITDQVVIDSGHDWMRGQESGEAYFARARQEAMRGQQMLTKETTQSSHPVMEKLRILLRKLSFRSQSAS